MNSCDFERRASGALYGLAIGDAFGAPYEFKKPPYVVKREYFYCGEDGVPNGVWTDDTSMALCLAQSLSDCSGFDARDQMNKYLMWRKDGYLSSLGRCFGIGITTSGALYQYVQTGEPYSGPTDERSSGNGSLMRLAPIAVFYGHNRDALMEYAAKSSMVTHAAPLAIDSCVFFAQLLRGALNGESKEAILSPDYAITGGLRSEVVKIAQGSYKSEKVFSNTGFVLHTLETALMAFYRFDTFEEGILHLASLGDDVDTVCAVYGQIAGAYYGVENLKKEWLDGLVEKEMINGVVSSLLCAAGTNRGLGGCSSL